MRASCPRCRRPLDYCWCQELTPVHTRTRLVFLQHVRESRVRIGTARMAHLSLANSEFHVGLAYPHAPGPRTAVLFPGEAALPPSVLAEGEPWTLVVVDGTWPQARKLVWRDPVLRALPRIGFVPERPGNYRIRREPTAEALATVEAVAQVLAQVEGEPARFAPMIHAFTRMVDLQIRAAADNGAVRKRPKDPGPSRAERERHALRTIAPRLALLHAEANAHPRGAGVHGPAEVVHVVAARGEATLDLAITPRRPLGAATPHHVGLAAEELQGPLHETLSSLSRFLHGAMAATWGPYPAQLLAAEGACVEWLDLRAVVARVLGRKPGAPEAAARALGAATVPLDARGRAGKVVAELAAIVRALAS